MVRRDPETGQFVSDGEVSWSEGKRLAGTIVTTIPAADLSGGSTDAEAEGEAVEMLDFTSFLENDEVFQIRRAFVSAYISAPTTSTAEGAVAMNYHVGSKERLLDAVGVTSAHYGGTTTGETGIVDITQQEDEAGGVWYADTLSCSPSTADSTNGLGAGAEQNHHTEQIVFGRDGPVYDRDDELYAPHNLEVDNVSDHAVVGRIQMLLHGKVTELG